MNIMKEHRSYNDMGKEENSGGVGEGEEMVMLARKRPDIVWVGKDGSCIMCG